MPVVKVSRAGVRSAPREVPTDTTLAVLPMTIDRVGRECAQNDQPTKVSSLAEAFAQFKPKLDFTTTVGEEGTELVAELELRSLRDFDPKKIRSREPGKRNDLSDLQARIDLHRRIRDRFAPLSLQKTWESTEEREAHISAVQQFEQQLRSTVDDAEAASPGGESHSSSLLAFLDRLAGFPALLSRSDGPAQALNELDAAIANMDRLRDDVLKAIYKQIRPLERSYKQIQLFFENCEVRDNVPRPPVGLFIFNADSKSITSGRESTTIVALDEFVRRRNDGFTFRQAICNLVVPGYIPDVVRKRFEEIANRWGMLFIGDLKDERSFRMLSDELRAENGAYEFLKWPEDTAASVVVIAGYLKLRENHWFEEPDEESEDPDLYSPASMLFAGSLARADRTSGGGIAQGPVGMIFGKIRGIEKSRIEPRISQIEQLAMERQVVSIIRNEDDDLCFVGSSSRTEDPSHLLRFFTSYRVLRYLERRIAIYLRRVAHQPLTGDLVKSQVREPIEDFLCSEKQKGTIYDFNLDIDTASDNFARGVLSMELEVLPVGPAETFKLKIDTPEFTREETE